MTNLEVLQFLLGDTVALSEERLRTALTFWKLNPDDPYDEDLNKCKIFGLAISEIRTSKGIAKITESGYTIEFANPSDSVAVNQLANNSGCPDLIGDNSNGKPTLKFIGRRS